MLETKIVKNYSRECCSRLSKEHEEPPGNGGRDGKPGQAAQGHRAAWTAPVSQLAAGSDNLTPVAF